MLHISISEEVATACPDLHVLVLSCDVCNSEPDERLWQEIADEEKVVRETVKLEQINKWLPIQATRQAYKRLGKDPNRYRPSSEALRRRILRELPLYKVDTLVDLINLVSIRSGYSIGGFDADKIAGGSLVLGVGREGEVYHGIGRGELNIAVCQSIGRRSAGSELRPAIGTDKNRAGYHPPVNDYKWLFRIGWSGVGRKVCGRLIKQICFSYKHGGGTYYS